MKYDYDPETDTLTVILHEGTPDHGEQTENIITHYTENGKPVETEILDASNTVLELIRPMLGTGRKTAQTRKHRKQALPCHPTSIS